MLTQLLKSTLQDHFGVIAFLLFLPCLTRLIRSRRIRSQLAHDKGCRAAKAKAPVRDPIIGLDFLYEAVFGKAPARYLDNAFKRFKQLGSTYTIERWTWTSVYTCDPQNIKQMLTSGSGDFDLPDIRTSIIEKLFGKGIFSLKGHAWAQSRTAIRQGFSRNSASLIEIMERHFRALSNLVPMDGTEFDLQPLFMSLAMDIATEFLMGHPTHMLDPVKDQSKEHQFVEDYALCSTEFVRQTQLGLLHLFKLDQRVRRAKQRMLEYVDSFIDKALLAPPEEPPRSSLLHHLVAAIQDRQVLRTQVLHVLLASRDTTAGLLSNLFFSLAKNPRVYAKLREDVLSVVGEKSPTAAQLKEMRYLRWCVNESLRLHPVIPSNAREALRDTTLPCGGGKDGMAPLLVPKGAIVIYTVYAMHRNGDVFGSDPEDFIPERWEGLRPGWGYLPFNGGNRTCLGQQHALLETYYIVARCAQTFKTLESRDDQDWAENYGLAMSSKNGTKVAVTG